MAQFVYEERFVGRIDRDLKNKDQKSRLRLPRDICTYLWA